MMKTIRSSVASASRVDDDEVVGGASAGAESGGSVVKHKVGSIVPVKYTDFAFSLDLTSKLPEHTGNNNHAIELVNDNLNHPQALQDKLGKVCFF